MDYSLPGSSVHGILQARIQEWVAVPFSRASSQLRNKPRSPSLQADSLRSEAPGKPHQKQERRVICYLGHLKKVTPMVESCSCSVAKLCLTLCDPMDCSPPGSPVHGILQARILEWGAISFSRRSSYPGIEPTAPVSPVSAGGFFTTVPPGNYAWRESNLAHQTH